MPDRARPAPQVASEFYELVVAYAKQETVEPLKSLGRWILFGVLGALLLGFGIVFLALAGLRALQTETGSSFAGHWSWAPYGIVMFALFIGGGFTWKTGTARRGERSR